MNGTNSVRVRWAYTGASQLNTLSSAVIVIDFTLSERRSLACIIMGYMNEIIVIQLSREKKKLTASVNPIDKRDEKKKWPMRPPTIHNMEKWKNSNVSVQPKKAIEMEFTVPFHSRRLIRAFCYLFVVLLYLFYSYLNISCACVCVCAYDMVVVPTMAWYAAKIFHFHPLLAGDFCISISLSLFRSRSSFALTEVWFEFVCGSFIYI